MTAQHNQVSNPTYFQTPAYFNLDATVGYDFKQNLKVNAGAFNITNAKYWNSAGRDRADLDQQAARSLRPARPVLRRQPHDQMVVPAALSAERLPAPSTRSPRVSMALSLALHGLAVLLLLPPAPPAAYRPSEQALLVELNLAAPASAEAERRSAADAPSTVASRPAEREIAIELAPPEEPPPLDVVGPEAGRASPPQPKPQPPAEARAAAAGRQARRAQARAGAGVRHGERGAADRRRLPARARHRLGRQAALSPSAHARRLPAARRRAQPARRGSGAGAARPRRLGRRGRAVPRQRLRPARQGRSRCRARLALPARDARWQAGRRLGRDSRPFPSALKGKPHAHIVQYRSGDPLASPARRETGVAHPRRRRDRWASARPSWWRWASARRRRRWPPTGARCSGDMPSVGRVMCLTRNEHCVHERHGRFEDVQVSGPHGLVLGPDIDLRLFLGQWRYGFAVREPLEGRRAAQPAVLRRERRGRAQDLRHRRDRPRRPSMR